MDAEEEERIRKRDAVIRQIETAFDGVDRKFGVSLHEAYVIDGYGGKWEQMRARMTDTEWRWQDVPEADIAEYASILSFLDPVGFRYYLPAYMVWTLKNYEDNDSNSVESLILALEISEPFRAHKMERFALFSRPQSEAVCAFLRFMVENAGDYTDEDTARQALKQYWGQFCPPEKSAGQGTARH